jgi:hypothetical protein
MIGDIIFIVCMVGVGLLTMKTVEKMGIAIIGR